MNKLIYLTALYLFPLYVFPLPSSEMLNLLARGRTPLSWGMSCPRLIRDGRGALWSLSVKSATVHTVPFRSLPFRTNRFALFCAPYFRIAAARVRFVCGPTFLFWSRSACCLFA